MRVGATMRTVSFLVWLAAAAVAQSVSTGTWQLTGAAGPGVQPAPAPTLMSLSVTPTAATQQNGAAAAFTATGTYSDGSTENLTTSATWSSGNSVVATLGTTSTTQNFNCSSAGTSTIRATVGAISASASLTCTLSAAGDNRYCASNGTWTGPATDWPSGAPGGPATAPSSCINTATANTPSPGSTVTVTAGSCTSLQSAIANAVAGQTIVIPALNGGARDVFAGCQVVPVTVGDANHWITVRTDQLSNLPPEGSRISPAWSGIASMTGYPSYAQPASPGTYLPKIVNSSSVVSCGSNAPAYWRWIGVEMTTTAGVDAQPAIFLCPNADHFVLDRMIIHGGDSATGRDTDSVQVGVRMTATNNAVIDSYIYDIHCVQNGICVDSYAIYPGGTGSTPNGVFKIVNNFLSAAGEEVITGGGGVGTSTLPVTDLEVRRNHMFKPLFWFARHPSYFGTSFESKNCFELKNADRVWFEGNICENSWGGQSDQYGTLINLGAKNQAAVYYGNASSDGAGNLTWTSGTQFRSSIVSANCAVANHCKVKYVISGTTYSCRAQTYADSQHISVGSCGAPAVPPSCASCSFTAFDPGLNPSAIVSNVVIRYNRLLNASRGIAVFAVGSDGGDISRGNAYISVHDNIADNLDGGYWNSPGGCCYWASPFQVQNDNASPYYQHDISLVHNTMLAFLSTGSAGGGPDLGFGYQSSASGAVTNLSAFDNISAAGWSGSASVCNTGSDNALNRWRCYDTLNGVAQNSYCFDHNLLATSTLGSISGTANNPPYPGASDSPGCRFTRAGQVLVSNYAAIQFVNLNGAIGGDYHLQATSPGHNAAHDGTDMGANVDAVNNAIAGVE